MLQLFYSFFSLNFMLLIVSSYSFRFVVLCYLFAVMLHKYWGFTNHHHHYSIHPYIIRNPFDTISCWFFNPLPTLVFVSHVHGVWIVLICSDVYFFPFLSSGSVYLYTAFIWFVGFLYSILCHCVRSRTSLRHHNTRSFLHGIIFISKLYITHRKLMCCAIPTTGFFYLF